MFRIGVGSSESIYKMFLYVFVVLLVRAYCLVMLMVPLFGIFSRMKELAKWWFHCSVFSRGWRNWRNAS